MKRFKRILFSSLAIIMTIGMFSFTAMAAPDQDNTLYFDFDSCVTNLAPYLDDENDPYTGPFTVEFNLYLDYSSEEEIDWLGIYWANDAGTEEYDESTYESGFYVEDDNAVSYWIGNNYYPSDTSLEFRKWTHVAFVYDGDNNLKIYLDGQLDTEFPETDDLRLPPWYVTMGSGGGEESAYYSMYNSALDDFRIWNVARTASEISANYASQLTAPYSESLVRSYKFDQGIGGADNTDIEELYDFAQTHFDGDLRYFDLTGDTSNFISVTALVDTETSTTENVSTPRVPQKRDPHTLLTGQVGGIQTTDLAYLVAIPEQWMDSTAKVEFWLDAATVTSKQEGYAYLDTAAATLKIAGSKLLESYDVRLMKRVTGQNGTVSEGEVALEYVRGNLTSRLPIPAQLQNTAHLGLCWIDETGAVAFLESKRVTIDGVSYLEFTNNNFTTAYAFIADPNHAAVVG